MNTAVVIFDPSQADEDVLKLLSLLKYVITNACDGQFKYASMMLSKQAKSHIHEFVPVDSPFIQEGKFVKCIHCDQCFPLLIPKDDQCEERKV
jgi:hypothetical protein